MSFAGYRKKSLPLCLSLGIAPILNRLESLTDDFLAPLSFEGQKAQLFNTNHFAAVCHNPHPKERKVNSLLISFVVRRILALKKHSHFPVLIVVRNKYEGEQLTEELRRHAVDYKLYNMIFSIRNKISQDFLTKSHTKAEFVLLTYNKLRELALKKVHPSTEQVVFLNPLTKYYCHQEVITLDVIISAFHRHKCHKPYFSFLFDAAQFPLLIREEYKALLGIDSCLFYGLQAPQRAFYDNKLSKLLPHLFDEHIQFFLLCELFRGRKNLKQLVKRFQQTISYQLFLFSNNLYPSFFSSQQSIVTERAVANKEMLDKKVYSHINRMVTFFSKGATTTIEGVFTSSDDSTNDHIFDNFPENLPKPIIRDFEKYIDEFPEKKGTLDKYNDKAKKIREGIISKEDVIK